jgi:UDP-N-acetylmuramate dehydrogenase
VKACWGKSSVQILRAEPLRGYNTLALQASAAALAIVTTDTDVQQAFAWAAAQGLPVVPLGEGSNVVFAGDLQALVLRQASRGIQVLDQSSSSVLLRVAAGEDWHRLVCWTLDQGYFGLENLAFIPGTVGAAPIQNIGAYGVEFERFVRTVHLLRIDDGRRQQLSREQCQFAYRESIFKNELRDQVVVSAVDIELARVAQPHLEYPALATELQSRGITDPQPRDVFDAVVAVRSRRLPDPAREPNAGSFFKNPVIDAAKAQTLQSRFPGLPHYQQADSRIKLPAAWLIEHCGWKGRREGDLGVHPEHALVMVNYGNGTGEELLSFASSVSNAVFETFAVKLEIEPRVYGLAA